MTRTTAFDPKSASDEELRQVTDLFNAAVPIDKPGSATTPHETWVALLTGADEIELRAHWAAWEADRLVGFASTYRSLEHNTHLLRVDIQVHPDHRRRGVGSALLEVLAREAREAGRARITALNLLKGGAGETFALARGFRATLGSVIQRLDIREIDHALWDVPPPEGYQLRTWIGPAPEELVVSYARVRQAIADAPRGEGSWTVPAWTPELVRKAEAEAAAGGIETRTAVAVHEGSGDLAGFTTLMVFTGLENRATQEETAVLRAHRGHGLGRMVKAANLRSLVADRPAMERVFTRTADDNVHMQRVNHQVGFATIRGHLDVEGETADIERRLAEK